MWVALRYELLRFSPCFWDLFIWTRNLFSSSVIYFPISTFCDYASFWKQWEPTTESVFQFIWLFFFLKALDLRQPSLQKEMREHRVCHTHTDKTWTHTRTHKQTHMTHTHNTHTHTHTQTHTNTHKHTHTHTHKNTHTHTHTTARYARLEVRDWKSKIGSPRLEVRLKSLRWSKSRFRTFNLGLSNLGLWYDVNLVPDSAVLTVWRSRYLFFKVYVETLQVMARYFVLK